MSLEQNYEELVQLYDKLRKANEDFLIENSGQEGFESLVNQRFEYLDNISIIRDNIVDELSNSNIELEYITMDLIDLIRELPRFFPNLLQYRAKVLESLQKLIESENNVSDSMNELRNDIKRELSHARTGKKTLNAYKPVTGYAGSHFIDSKK